MNGTDFTTGAPNPRNSTSPAYLCNPAPALTATPSSLTGLNGLTYVVGNGSAAVPISVSGINFSVASGNVTAVSSNPAQFTVSPSAAAFTSFSLTSTSFTVGLATGLPTGTYSASITFEGGGATTVVPVSGTVTTGPNLTINDVTIVEGNNGTQSMVFAVSLASPAPVGGVTFDIGTANGSAQAGTDYAANSLTSQTILSGNSSYSFSVIINGDVSSETDESFSVVVSNLVGANQMDGVGIGTITNDDATFISTIQGSGTTAALTGVQLIEGIVTRVFAGTTALNAFYIQEEDADSDGNPATSEGIGIFDPTGAFSGAIGDKVRLLAPVGEFATNSGGVNSSLTQMTLTSAVNLTHLGASTLPTVTTVTFPVANQADLERYENMLVTIQAATGNLTVTDHFSLGRFGQVTLAATDPATNQAGTDPRIDQYTQFNPPGAAGYAAYSAAVAKRLIILDDAAGVQNPPVIIHARGGNPLSATNTLRAGDDVPSITGILDERFEGYRIQTNMGVNFNATNARTNTPPPVGGTLTIVGFNVLNYFTDLDNNQTVNIPNGVSFVPRGAETAGEFTRQRDKIIAAITAIDPNVLGVIEMENNGSVAIQNLVDGLNTATAPGTFTFVDDASLINDPNPALNAVGTDAIKVALIYKPASVTPIGLPISSTNSAFDRPPLAQAFRQISNGARFSVIVNHFKSKGSGTGINADQNDGQGASNADRVAQAAALIAFVPSVTAAAGDPDVLLLGDYNAYAQETPIANLTTAGFASLRPASDYSYGFSGQFGSLDYAFANASLTNQVTGSADWHINADEPVILDYNTNFKTNQPGMYAADPFRTSDHDPVIVGLNLVGLTATLAGTPTTVCADSPVTFTASVAGFGASYSYTLTNGTNTSSASIQTDPSFVTSIVPTTGGAFTLTVNSAEGAVTAVVGSTLIVTPRPARPTYTLTNNGTVCVGSSLTAAVNGCSAGIVSFTVSPPTGSGIAINNPPAAYIFEATTAPGTYTLCARCTENGCISPMALTTVTIATLPVATLLAGSPVLCAGGNVTLTAGTGANYAFNGPGLSQDGVSPTAIASSGGVFSVVVTNASGCTATTGVSLSLNTSGVVIGSPAVPAGICAGSALIVPVVVTGPVLSYQWLRNGSPLGGQTSATLSINNAQQIDAATYSLSVVGGCGSAVSLPFTIILNQQPAVVLTFPGGTLLNPATLPTIQLPTPGQVQVSASGGVAYSWVLVIGRINGYEFRRVENNANGGFTIDRPGPYRVTVTATNGCMRTVEGLITN